MRIVADHKSDLMLPVGRKEVRSGAHVRILLPATFVVVLVHEQFDMSRGHALLKPLFGTKARNLSGQPGVPEVQNV